MREFLGAAEHFDEMIAEADTQRMEAEKARR